MKKVKRQMQMARQKGMSNIDLLRMREIARKEAEKMENEATEKAFLYMLAIPLNILVHDYWSKSAKKRAPRFIADVISLYESVQEGVVTDEELADLLYNMAGVKIEADWLKGAKDGQ